MNGVPSWIRGHSCRARSYHVPDKIWPRDIHSYQFRPICIEVAGRVHQTRKRQKVSHLNNRTQAPIARISKHTTNSMERTRLDRQVNPIELRLFQDVFDRHQLSRQILGAPKLPSTNKCDSYCTFTTFSDGTLEIETHHIREPTKLTVDCDTLGIPEDELPERLAWRELYLQGTANIAEPTLSLQDLSPEDREAFEEQFHDSRAARQGDGSLSKRHLKKQVRISVKKENRRAAIERSRWRKLGSVTENDWVRGKQEVGAGILDNDIDRQEGNHLMTPDSPNTPTSSDPKPNTSPVHHRPLVVGLRKPASQVNIMASAEQSAALNKEIEQNITANTKSAAPAEGSAAGSEQPKTKKVKPPKQPKAAPAAAPTSPALIDLRVGHILRAIAHPNADSLYVSTIAMGDPEGTEHTQIDEETGKVVRTVCSGLKGLVPLEEMQNRKIVVVANLKPVNMRSVKSAAMVLAASPKPEEGADPHAPDRVVELVLPPEGSEAGDKVYFEGWPYGDGRGPEKQLNPKKKQWEAIQPGFYTGDDLVVGFDASKCEDVSGNDKGNLVVDGKGVCTVKTLKDAVVR